MSADGPDPLDRRFEAFVFDWDGTAVPDRSCDADDVRRLVEALCDVGAHVVVVSGTHLGNIDGQLQARPAGPGRLLMHLNRGSELFEVGPDGPHVVRRREATSAEDAALSRAAALTVERLAERGLRAEIVSQRLNRRKIDLIPLPEWADPPKAVIDELLVAVEARLAACGLSGLPEVVDLALEAARESGLADPRVTSDAKHVEIGLTDKSHSAREVLAELRASGVGAGLILVAGDEFGPLGGLAGSDSLMCVPEIARSTVMSVGVEPHGVPPGVLHRPGGPAVFLAVLADQLLRRAEGELPAVDDEPGWHVATTGVDHQLERSREALLTLADGVIGTSGAPLLTHPAATPSVVVGGVYAGDGPATDLLAAPRWERLEGSIDDGAAGLRRVLDLRSGLLGEWVAGAAGPSLAAVRAALLARPGGAVLRVRSSGRSRSPLQAPDGAVEIGADDGPRSWMVVRGSPGSVAAAAVDAEHDDRGGFDRLAFYAGFPRGPADHRRALSGLAALEAAGFERLVVEQRAAWGRRWEAADVVLDGDDELQLALRVSLFHLMASVASEGEAALGARGLSGRAYRGHVFWDADTFVLPFLAATHPPAARAMLEYRLRRLPAALAAAGAEGRAGARFPWESASTGDDVTPPSARDQSGRTVPIRTGDAEVHIVAQVAWAASQYLDWTGDEEFAAGPAHRIFVETARYWASRARRDATGRAHIYGVIGPDEYHEPVDDSACTNVLARWNLRRAAREAEERADRDRVDDDEIRRWLDLADALVDGYDPATGIYEQFSGFFDLEPLLISEVAPRRPIVADLLLGRERVRGAQVVKQADVLMLHHLVPDEVEAGSLAPNLEYYEPRTAHGSSLSPGVHAGLFARAGRLDDAVETLRLAARVDLDDLTRTTAGGLHLATMGSVWQALAFGFLGLRPRGDTLAVDPRRPPGWEGYEMAVRFRGVPLRIRVDAAGLRLQAGGAVKVDVRGVPATVGPGEVVLELVGDATGGGPHPPAGAHGR